MANGLTGTFKDYENNFSCETLEEWIEHLGKTDLTYKGTTECVTCGDPVEFEWTGKLKNGKTYPTVLCEVCKAQ
jgi:hypothetical protein